MSRYLCAEVGLLGLHEPDCDGFGSRSDELCERAEREAISAGTWPEKKPEGIADYAYAADAWIEHELTLAMMRYRNEVARIAFEFERRKAVERHRDALRSRHE